MSAAGTRNQGVRPVWAYPPFEALSPFLSDSDFAARAGHALGGGRGVHHAHLHRDRDRAAREGAVHPRVGRMAGRCVRPHIYTHIHTHSVSLIGRCLVGRSVGFT